MVEGFVLHKIITKRGFHCLSARNTIRSNLFSSGHATDDIKYILQLFHCVQSPGVQVLTISYTTFDRKGVYPFSIPSIGK